MMTLDEVRTVHRIKFNEPDLGFTRPKDKR
jgi:hypothetical protein